MPNMNLKKLWRKKSVTITEYDPTYKVVYLGNVLTGWAKGEGCVDKPLSTLWRNYCQSNRQDIGMKVTICGAGLRAVTREHGLTEYWAHRVTYCAAHPAYPRVFCWVYRHEGRRLKQELRCHAVLCPKAGKAEAMAAQLRVRLSAALQEFRREKVVRQNARLSLMHAIYDSAAIPRRRLLLSTGSSNYRPPLERSKSAPKLGAIEESLEEEEEEVGLVNSDEEDIDELDEAASVHLHPEDDAGLSSTVSETTSDIVVDYDSSSEVASAGQDHHFSLEEEFEDGSPNYPFCHSDTPHYCPVPPLSPISDAGESGAGSRDAGSMSSASGDVAASGKDLGLLASLTGELSLAPPTEESLTSDQPESLGSHCDSCNSSCGACSDPCDVAVEQEHLISESSHIISDNHILREGESPGKMARMEGDNISEESGYSEDKDSLQNLDATKL